MATELEPVAFASVDRIGREDARVTAFIDRMARDCRDSRVVVLSSGGAIDWRRAMYYVPANVSVCYDNATRPVLAAHQRQVRTISESEQLTSLCEALWVGDVPPAGSTPDTLPGAWRLSEPIAADFASGQQLTIR